MSWMPNKCRHQLNMIMFWIHLLQTNNERVVKKVYNECKSLTDNHNHKNWVWEIKSTLAECGLNSWWHQSSCDGLLYGEAKHLLPAVSSTWRGRIGNPTLQVKQSWDGTLNTKQTMARLRDTYREQESKHTDLYWPVKWGNSPIVDWDQQVCLPSCGRKIM